MNLSNKDLKAIVDRRTFKVQHHWLNRAAGIFAGIFIISIIAMSTMNIEAEWFSNLILGILIISAVLEVSASLIYGRMQRQAASTFTAHYFATGELLPEGPDGKTVITEGGRTDESS